MCKSFDRKKYKTSKGTNLDVTKQVSLDIYILLLQLLCFVEELLVTSSNTAIQIAQIWKWNQNI